MCSKGAAAHPAVILLLQHCGAPDQTVGALGVSGARNRSSTGRVLLSMQTLRAAPWQLWFLVLGAIWGCSFLFIKLGLESLTPIGVAFRR